jgi:hypothetical protein
MIVWIAITFWHDPVTLELFIQRALWISSIVTGKPFSSELASV